MKKRCLAFLLALCMVMPLLPATALAAESAVQFAGGDGTEENPYQIATAEQLNAIRNELNAHYLQIADIDLSGIEWNPIGQVGAAFDADSIPFSGLYDGNGYKISSLTISKFDADNVCIGLFATSKGVLKNISLEDCSINIDVSSGYVGLGGGGHISCVGGIVGSANGAIENCTVSGYIGVSNVYSACIGGIVGIADTCINSTNIASINIGGVEYGTSSGTIQCGGIVGTTSTVNSTINDCVNYGNIIAVADNFLHCGGISGKYGAIDCCTNYGNISGNVLNYKSYSSFGGNCNVGGIVGLTSSNKNNNCKNYGDVSSTKNNIRASCYSGGIGGYVGTYDNGIPYGMISNCYNYGANITADDQRTGRVAGSLSVKKASELYSSALTLVNGKIPTNDIGCDKRNGANLEEVGTTTTKSVYFLSGWDAATRTVKFGDSESTPITYTVANSVDVSNISSLLNKYVLVTMKQGDNSLKYTITDIKPVESKIGTVSEVYRGEGSLAVTTFVIDEVWYTVWNGSALPNPQWYKGKEVLYHLSSFDEIISFDVLEKRHGVFGGWNEATKKVTIGGIEYPTNQLTDFSFKNNKDYLNNEVNFLVADSTDYYPLLKITGVDDSKVNNDTYIVEEVKKYASQTDIDQLNDIFASKDSDIVKMQRLQEFFALNGFTDIKEGVKYYTQDSFAERQAYKKLTTDECFTAYQTQKFLDDHPEWRALLVTDGLIFNGELNTYINPLTYADLSKLPDVAKYKDVLYEFMDAQSFDVEVMNYISWFSTLAGKSEDAAKIYADNLISQINKCKDNTELKALMNKASTKDIMLKLGYDNTKPGWELEYKLDENTGFGKFNKAMGHAGKFISAYNLTVNTAIDFMELDSKLAVYASYKNFLNEVATAKDLPLGMRGAAAYILQEIDSGKWGRLKELALDIVNQTGVGGMLKEEGLTKILGQTGYASVSEVLLYLDIGSWAINQVVDISSIVKGSASAEAYSKLSTHFKNKLEESRITFLSNQTPENAWTFYENYNILYSLRKNGEKAALKAHTFKVGSKGALGFMLERGYGYLNAAKEECVSEILDELEKCKFTVAPNIKIPESVKYVSKALTACPVNVEVYAPDGTYITTLQDGVESDKTNEYGRFAVVYRTFTGDYAKVICMSQKGDYKFNIVGTGDGLVDFEMATTKGSNTEIYKFSNEPVSKGTLIKASPDDLVNRQLYSVDMDGDGVVDKEKNATKIGEQTAKVSVENITLSETTVSLRTGESKLLTVEVIPNNATTQKVLWTSSDTHIADVKDGKIIAKATGSTVIHCIAQDNPDIVATCNVIVTGNSQIFTDVPSDAWYYDAVKFVSEQKLMNGVGNNLFDPQSNLSRAQLAQILYNKEGKPAVTDNSSFSDVSAGQWYTSAVIWANKQGIVGGYGNGLFGPNDDITREQLAVMLWRYAGKPAASGTALNFTDADKVSSWALDAMRWATEKGIVNGKGNGILDPGGKATRAETAQMLKNFLEK